jgi:hypothetical protein
LNWPYGEIAVTDEDRAAARRYAAVIEWSDRDGVYVATVPDIPNLHTHGATREAAATSCHPGDRVILTKEGSLVSSAAI